MDFKEVLDRIDELVYLSDINTYELLFVNSYGPRPATTAPTSS